VKIWTVLLLGFLAVLLKAGLAMVPPVAPLADPLLVLAVLAALPGRRWLALGTGLVTGALDDAMFGQWLGLHAFSQMTIAFALSVIASKVDMLQPLPALLAMGLAALVDWGIQIGLAALFNRSADVIPAWYVWTAAVVVNTMLGLLFYRLAARRGSLA
jgi:cell shape-determining protein MreD